MADRLRGVPFAPKMYAFQAEISRNQQIGAGRRAQHSTVIADPGDQASAAEFRQQFSLHDNFRQLCTEVGNPRNQRSFW